MGAVKEALEEEIYRVARATGQGEDELWEQWKGSEKPVGKFIIEQTRKKRPRQRTQ